MQLVYNFKDNSLERETIVLQPGRYRVIYRPKYSNKSIYTVEKKFDVESGKSVNVRLYR